MLRLVAGTLLILVAAPALAQENAIKNPLIGKSDDSWVQYPWRQTAADIADNLGIITPINDYPGDGEDSRTQLTYTHAFPGNKLLLSIGQYPSMDAKVS